MSDHKYLILLLDQYTAELNRRKTGDPGRIWDSKLCEYVDVREKPRNKARLTRLRLEIGALMLNIERQMHDGSYLDEGWYK